MDEQQLAVWLGDTRVGALGRTSTQGIEFRLSESYKAAYPRPVLGQRFLDDPDQVWTARGRLPDWFSNLLPEGALRALIAQQAQLRPDQEFALLRHLGEDLPGAVRVTVAPGESPSLHDLLDLPNRDAIGDSPWHFSLAGVQLKFSGNPQGRGLTVPASGMGGRWIIKLQDARWPDVPNNEFATMQWARESGIEVPQTRLLDIGLVSGLPPEAATQGLVYAVRRFDRPAEATRVHIEDFAQVLGLYPEAKYAKYGYETIANVVAALAGEEGLREFVRRLVFVVASGNGDAHHKNWSLIYTDSQPARLSPAYDLVSTIQYMPSDRLALTFARSKRWEDVSLSAFARLARKIDRPEPEVLSMVQESIEAVMTAWSASKAAFGYSSVMIEQLERHMRRVPLLAASIRPVGGAIEHG